MAKKKQKKKQAKKSRTNCHVKNKIGQIQGLFAQATRYHQTGQFVQAEQLYRNILNIAPKHADSLHLLGLILADRGLLNEGLELINQAIVNNPKFAAFYLNRGLLYKRMKQPEKAMTDYIKTIQLAPQMVEAHYNLGDALTEAEQLDEAIVAYQTALKYAPQHRNTHNNLGNVYLAKEQYQQAINCYKNVLNLDAKCAETLSNLGVAYFKLQHYEDAIKWQKKTIYCDPNYAQAHSNLGLVLNHLGKFIEAEQCYHKALELQPDNAEFHSNLGVNYKDQNNVDTALKCFKKSLELNPNSPEAQFNKAISLLLKGDFIAGWQGYESRFGLKERVHTNPHFTEPVWQGEDFSGTLLVYVEQGLGDTLQFVRYLPLVVKQGGKIILECQQELVLFFELQKDQLGIDQIIPRGVPKPAFDYHIALMSLPRIFQTTLDSIPYVPGYLKPVLKKTSAPIVEKLQQDSRYKVGLIWAGGKQHKNDHNRSIAFASLQPLLQLSAISFYSLQYGENNTDFFFQAEDGIRDSVASRGLGDVYKRQVLNGIKELRNSLIIYLTGLISRLLDSISHQQNLTNIIILQQTLQSLSDFINQLYNLPITEYQLNELAEHRQNFAQAFAGLETAIANFKKTLLANFDPKHLHQSNGLLRRNFASEPLDNAMKIYYDAHALKETLKQFSSLKNNFHCCEIPINTYLAKEAYDDFILIIHLHKPEHLGNILRQYKDIFQLKLNQTKKQTALLKRRLEQEFFAALRVQRIINIYQLWEKHLTSNQYTQTRANDLTHFLQLYRLFTYEKKAIFKQGFAGQFLYVVLQDLNAFMQTSANINENNTRILLDRLMTNRNELRTRVRNLEEQLQSQYRGMQKILADTFSAVVLGVLQHPEYQLGRFTSEFMDHSFTQCSGIPVLNEALPPDLKNKLGHASGFAVLLISLIFSTRLGYSYHLVATITRIPLSHINALFRLGEWLDSIGYHVDHKFLTPLENLSPQQLTYLFEQYRSLIRWDELGVIEKDTLLQWITGLGIHLMLTMISGGQWFIPAITGYGVATGCREIAGWVTKKVAQIFGLSQETSTFAQVMAHITAYTCTYPYGFRLGAWFSPRQSAELSYAEALKVFGLHSSTTQTEIRKRFHELGLQYHPDKCQTEQCARQMVQIDRAYETLKMQ